MTNENTVGFSRKGCRRQRSSDPEHSVLANMRLASERDGNDAKAQARLRE